MKKIILLSFLSLSSLIIYGQNYHTAYHWFFGNNAGVNFSTGIAKSDTTGALYSGEGCSTIDDRFGNLLFYTDGQTIFNKNNVPMPNGSNLMGHWSATQSSLIVPYPNSDSLFYVFTVDALDNHLQNGLRYNIVNMSLDSGLGDIIPNKKNILLETPVCEKLSSVMHSNFIDIWVIAHRWNSNEFITYKITSSGIDTIPVVSAVGSIHQGGYSSDPYLNGWVNAAGQMKANINGNKIAVAICRANFIELFDFDRATGQLSNCISSPTIYDDVFGIEFSPNGNKLYISQTTSSQIFQFDLTQPNPLNTSTFITFSPNYQTSSLQLAQNGKIYISERYNPFLSVINFPNLSGLSCNFVENGVFLDGKVCRRGLPTLYFDKNFHFITGSEVDTSICMNDSIFLQNSYQTTPGIYYDTLQSSQGWDSIITYNLSIYPLISTPVITDSNNILIAHSDSATNFQWYLNGNLIIGANGSMYQPFITGDFQVAVSNGNGCWSFSDIYHFIYTSYNTFATEHFLITEDKPHNSIIIKLKGEFNIRVFQIKGTYAFSNFNCKDIAVINFSDKPKGIYIIQVFNLKDSETFKYIKL